MNLLPSHGQICEHSCNSFLCFTNFFLLSFAFVTTCHGTNLWAFLQKPTMFHFFPQAFLKSLFKNFYFVVLQELVVLRFCFQALLKLLFMNFFLSSFASTIKPLGIFVSICVRAYGASLLFPSFLEIIIQECFSL